MNARGHPLVVDAKEASRLLIAEYGRMARVADQHTARYHAPIARRLLELAEVKRGAQVLDLGCGTGVASFEAAAAVGPGGSVTGIDLAEETVRLAAKKSSVQGLSHLRFEVMDARRLRFPEESFDVVLSCFGHPLTGRDACFAEVRRVLRRGGPFCLVTWNRTTSPSVPFREILERRRPSVVSSDVAQLIEARKVLASSEEGKLAQSTEGWVRLLETAGFSQVRAMEETHRAVFPDPDAYLDHALASGDNEREIRRMTPEDRAAFRDEFQARVRHMMTNEGFVVNWSLRYLLGRADPLKAA